MLTIVPVNKFGFLNWQVLCDDYIIVGTFDFYFDAVEYVRLLNGDNV